MKYYLIKANTPETSNGACAEIKVGYAGRLEVDDTTIATHWDYVELTEEDIKRILNSFPRPTMEEMENRELGAKLVNEYKEQVLDKIGKVLNNGSE